MPLGLSTKSNAPSRSAWVVSAAPTSVSALTTITPGGFGRLTQFAEHAQPVDLWHLEVERDRIGMKLIDFLERSPAVGRGTHDFDGRLQRERIADHLAEEHRIVNDKHAHKMSHSIVGS